MDILDEKDCEDSIELVCNSVCEIEFDHNDDKGSHVSCINFDNIIEVLCQVWHIWRDSVDEIRVYRLDQDANRYDSRVIYRKDAGFMSNQFHDDLILAIKNRLADHKDTGPLPTL